MGYEQPWTTTASTGTVDEADLAIVDLSASMAQIKLNATVPATLDIRYNVVAINTFANIFAVRFRDNGPEAQVIVRLKELNLSTGAVATKATFDSNGFPASTGYQLRSIVLGNPCGGLNLNFVSNAYYLEVQVIKTGPGGFPGLSGMQIAWGPC